MCYACFNANYPDDAETAVRQGTKFLFDAEA